MKKKIFVIFGTRPEAIKLAPLIIELKKNSRFECVVCVTAQHREMLDQVLDVFDIVPDIDFNIMKSNQTLTSITIDILNSLDSYLKIEKPDMVIVQGDTTTVLSASLAAFYNQIPITHLEAGLRTFNLKSPWPEEGNRVLTSRLAELHFAPTEVSKVNLLKEGIAGDKIFVTGNSVIPALFLAIDIIKIRQPLIPGITEIELDLMRSKKIVLITGHRRENFGDGFDSICQAISYLANKFINVEFIFPVHLNPNVREPVYRILKINSQKNIKLLEPLSYLPFIRLMDMSTIILTDSGGIQEEAPSLGKPVLVMRDTTERPEAVDAGTVKLIGTNKEKIIEEVTLLLTDHNYFKKMSMAHNPYGDVNSVKRMIDILDDYFNYEDGN